MEHSLIVTFTSDAYYKKVLGRLGAATRAMPTFYKIGSDRRIAYQAGQNGADQISEPQGSHRAVGRMISE